MNIGFDLDGVLYDWHTAIYDYFIQNNKFDGSWTYFWTDYWRDEAIQQIIGYLVSVPIFYGSKVPLASTMNLLNKLAEEHTIFYITTRPDSVVFATEQYLNKWKFPFTENLFITPEKEAVARHVELELFIDDRESNLDAVSKVCLSVLRARPWNKVSWNKYPTIFSLEEIYKFIK